MWLRLARSCYTRMERDLETWSDFLWQQSSKASADAAGFADAVLQGYPCGLLEGG